jgi:DNA-binding CsgD family transcriptional regulator
MAAPSHADVSPTPREQQVLELICQGYSTKRIAAYLGIATKTVSCHRMRLLDKAEVHNCMNLFRWAVLHGFITVEGRKPPTSQVVPGYERFDRAG